MGFNSGFKGLNCSYVVGIAVITTVITTNYVLICQATQSGRTILF